MKWFIVAIVYFTGVEEAQFVQMEEVFDNKNECQQFYINEPDVQNDVMLMYPNQSSHTLVCLSELQIQELKGEKSA